MTKLTVAACRNLGIAAVFAAATGFAPGQANAANFFEQLFGGGGQAPSQEAPVYAPSEGLGAPPSTLGVPSEPHRRRHAAILRTEPVRQKTTDLMHDKTLRSGDAVVTKAGIEVYAGRETARHTMSEFVPLDDADLASKEKQKLVAMDTTRVDPLANAPLREGRSASDASSRAVSDGRPITKGYKVTDATGKSVRYVGP